MSHLPVRASPDTTAHLHVVVFTQVGGLQVEMHEVQLDFKSLGHGDVPRHFRVAGIGIGEVWGADLPKHLRQLNGIRHAEQPGTERPGQGVPGKHTGKPNETLAIPKPVRAQSGFPKNAFFSTKTLTTLCKVAQLRPACWVGRAVAPCHRQQTLCRDVEVRVGAAQGSEEGKALRRVGDGGAPWDPKAPLQLQAPSGAPCFSLLAAAATSSTSLDEQPMGKSSLNRRVNIRMLNKITMLSESV